MANVELAKKIIEEAYSGPCVKAAYAFAEQTGYEDGEEFFSIAMAHLLYSADDVANGARYPVEPGSLDAWYPTIAQAVAAATTLDDLCAALNAYEADADNPQTLDEVVDMAALPTFGGDEPCDTSGVWSWDADRVLVGEGGRFTIEARDPAA